MSTKDWIEKDYYKVLGVDKKASAEEIRKAFRKIARDNHPDANPGDKAAEARFKEAAEANTILSNPEKRKEYDEARSLFGGAGVRFGRSGSGGGSTGFEDLFRNAGGAQGGFGDLFGNLFGGSGSSGSRRSSQRGPRRGADIEGEVKLAFEQAVEGTTVAMRTMSDEACSACRGTGAKSGTLPKVCPGCDGSGMRSSTSGGVFSMSEPCTDCRGRGLLVEDPCPACNGSGRGKSTNTVNVRIPAGVIDGQKIRIKGKGVAGQNGGAAGDLYVTVHVTPHKLFGQQGNNLTIEVPVTFAEASLGADIQIPTLQGPRVKLRVPPNTPNGRTLRVRGKGVRRKDGTMGDLLGTIQVKVPEHLSEAARNALQEYAQKAGQEDPRAALFGE